MVHHAVHGKIAESEKYRGGHVYMYTAHCSKIQSSSVTPILKNIFCMYGSYMWTSIVDVNN